MDSYPQHNDATGSFGVLTMSFRQIQYFVAVAKSGSFSAAARNLRISQPALTLQVKQLEERLGTKLLIRYARGVELTEAGKVFLGHSNNALESLDRGEREVAAFKKSTSEEVSIGFTPTVGRALMPDLLAECSRRKPPLGLLCREGLSDDLWYLATSAELDLAFCYDPLSADTIKIVPLYREDLYLVGPRDLVDTSQGKLDLARLNDFRLMLGQRKHRTRRLIEAAAHDGGADIRSALEIELIGLKREMLLHHGYCSVVPYGLFLDEIKAGQMGVRRIRPAITRTATLIINKGIRPSAERYLVSTTRMLVDQVGKRGEFGWRPP